MKNLKYFIIALISLGVLQAASAQTKADKKAAKAADIKRMVEARNFDFIAQYANPQRGGHRYLTSDYDFVIKRDSLIAYLPYFGRAYFDVPYNPTDGGIKFTSTDYSYKVTEKKKGGWDILIQPKDVKYYRKISLYVSPEGSAYLQFIITNRDGISFDGNVEANKNSKGPQ